MCSHVVRDPWSEPASYSSPQSSAQKKRTRAGAEDGRRFDASRVPPLPPLTGDLILQVFTHKSLRRKDVSSEHYDDNERLSHLGQAAFDLALTRYLFGKRPMLRAEDLTVQRTLLYKSGMIQDWVKTYGLMKRLRSLVDDFGLVNSSEEIFAMFYAYVGAVFQSSGPDAVHSWVDGLLAQENLIQPESVVKPDPYPTISHTLKRMKLEPMSPPPAPVFLASQPPPIPPVMSQPLHPPSSSFSMNPLAPAQPRAAFLPLFNEAAMKRRVTVEYLGEFSGQAHAGQWTVKCMVNGLCKGEANASHKQTAKEEAARKAYYNMGWQ